MKYPLFLEQVTTRNKLPVNWGYHLVPLPEKLKTSTKKRKHYPVRYTQECADQPKERIRGNRLISEHLGHQGVSRNDLYDGYGKIRLKEGTCTNIVTIGSNTANVLYVGKGSNIPHRVSIHEIPKKTNGKRLGYFEMDLIVGTEGRGLF